MFLDFEKGQGLNGPGCMLILALFPMTVLTLGGLIYLCIA